ncbi:MAG: hypothetical protein AAF634_08135 [Bacteroidota bacterium]
MKLTDSKIDIKLKLSSLWDTLMALYIYGDYFELYTPNKVSDLLAGNNILDSPLKLFGSIHVSPTCLDDCAINAIETQIE